MHQSINLEMVEIAPGISLEVFINLTDVDLLVPENVLKMVLD
ncbi:MAG: hypothetical protein ACKVJC_01815 [Flavobacteriales bacterium]